jgi:D-alanyl-lipoteichoic acid acyltransferase DltB (MBOAT superfamily)
MMVGFFKKIVVADQISKYVDAVYNNATGGAEIINGLTVAIATVLFAVQIYCDFSGYTDIAIGCARVLGIRLMQNFNDPYSAINIKDFWRRWHISLTSWFTDYVYIPLGGSRCKKWRHLLNVMIVFLLSGIWHGAANINVIGAWIGAIAYLMQIYYDFSAYSDMAIGLGWMFGFHFKENFNHPYIASSIQDFWRRWHISLSTFFRDYVYIPLGGNRKGKVRTVVNRIIVFFLTGLWHGANWTFVIWGMFHGFFLLLEEFIPLIKKLPKFLRHIYTLLTVTVGFVIFRADTIREAWLFICQMFSGFDFSPAVTSYAVQALTPYFIVMLLAAIVCCGPLEKHVQKLCVPKDKEDLTHRETVLLNTSFVLACLLLVWCILRLAGGSYNPFIYFRF